MATKKPICNYSGELKEMAATDRPSGVRSKCSGLAMPGDYYSDVLTVFPLWLETDAALTVSKLKISCDANPATELDCDFMFADSWPTLANATVIDVADTTDGEFEASSGFDDATVPAGKCLYVRFGAAPDAALKFIGFQVEYSYD